MTIELLLSSQRFVTRDAGRETFHSFSFGRHYDPGNVGFASMVAHNDEHLPPGTGYDDHPHRDTEIVTWVLDGALRHTDSTGHTAVLGPGTLLRTSAGSGIVHSEVTEPGVTTRFLQTWLHPDEPGVPPSFAEAEVGEQQGLVEVVGPGGAIGIGTEGARLHVVREADGELTLPEAPLLHLFVVEGHVEVGDRALRSGDSARLSEEGGRTVRISQPATLSVWSFT